MIYWIVRWIGRLTLRSYFKHVVITGYGNIPQNRPIIFVSNHPSAFMDPIVVATTIGKPIYFLAAAEFMGKGIKSWIHRNLLNMIPIYRPTTLAKEMHKNSAVFVKCFELLNHGGFILVFPEGNSVTERKVRKLKTGVARMAIGANESSPQTSVVIVPVGLNYSDPHRFQSELYINIGRPIETNNYSMANEDVERLTGEVERELKSTVLHIEDEEVGTFVKNVESLLGQDTFDSITAKSDQKKHEFIFLHQIIHSIQFNKNSDSQKIADTKVQLEEYLKKTKMLGISADLLSGQLGFSPWAHWIRLIITFPIFAFGIMVNSIPYYATVFYFRRLNLFHRVGKRPPRGKVNPAFRGSVGMAIGMVFFILYYLIAGGLVISMSSQVWVGILMLPLFYFSGLFSMRYIRWVFMLKQKLKIRNTLHKMPDEVTSLTMEREEILKDLRSIILQPITP